MSTLELYYPEGATITANWPIEAAHETKWEGATVLFPKESETFYEMGNNPAFDFLNEPGEDIYDEK